MPCRIFRHDRRIEAWMQKPSISAASIPASGLSICLTVSLSHYSSTSRRQRGTAHFGGTEAHGIAVRSFLFDRPETPIPSPEQSDGSREFFRAYRGRRIGRAESRTHH